MKGKHILLGITGSIAAYKVASLTRLFIKAGAEVRVVMTKAATDFISPLTLSTLSKNIVHTDISEDGSWANHVEIGLWADLMIIAPATANTLGKMANGLSDNMLVATYLSSKCPIWIAPAMDLDMWDHPSTKSNLDKLRSYGNRIIPVGYGDLASGLVGDGRMAEIEDLFKMVKDNFEITKDLQGINVIVTAGPTQEALDPVRYITNHSSGKMGIAIAEELANRGAKVDLILGPTDQKTFHRSIITTKVVSAKDMYDAVAKKAAKADLFVFAAAVADYTPVKHNTKKIKKTGDGLDLPLKRTTDIAGTVGQKKRADQVMIGFALETDNEEANAKNKLNKKKFNLIVLNSLKSKGAGFKKDTNKITIFDDRGEMKRYGLKSKVLVAKDIVDYYFKNYSK